jgi:hypothetical protein
MTSRPAWHALLAPIPEDAVIERKPVASPQQIADGSAAPIAGWDSITMHLSAPNGLRHVMVTLDADDTLLSGGDAVLFDRQEHRDGVEVKITDHENIGGRFERDGSFRGTYWQTRTEQVGDDDEGAVTQSTPFPPTAEQIAALRRVVADVLRRAPARKSPG